MKSQPKSISTAKDWELFFLGDKDELYACFHIFYDDFYRLGLSWYKNSDIVKESIHNLFIELWKIWQLPKEIKNKKQYVISIFRNICHKTYKISSPNSNIDLSVEVESVNYNYELSYEDLLIANQTSEHQKNQLNQAIKRLTNRQIEIIKLRYFEGLAFQEIAKITSLTERTVYNTLHNAIRQLREHLMWLILAIANLS